MNTAVYTGHMQDDLSCLVDRALLRFKKDTRNRWQSRQLRNAMAHLTDVRQGKNYPIASRWPEMDEHDADAYQILRRSLNEVESEA